MYFTRIKKWKTKSLNMLTTHSWIVSSPCPRRCSHPTHRPHTPSLGLSKPYCDMPLLQLRENSASWKHSTFISHQLVPPTLQGLYRGSPPRKLLLPSSSPGLPLLRAVQSLFCLPAVISGSATTLVSMASAWHSVPVVGARSAPLSACAGRKRQIPSSPIAVHSPWIRKYLANGNGSE